MKIVLLGYMASGKSLIGKELAAILDYKHIDLDDYIEAKEGLSIPEIFSEKGEIYFRKVEHNCLLELIDNRDKLVLSLGGGTPCYANNMNSLTSNKDVKTIYLQVSIPNLVDRLLQEPNKRPIVAHLNQKEEFIEFIGKHLFERAIYYNKAELKVNANAQSAEVLERILLELF